MTLDPEVTYWLTYWWVLGIKLLAMVPLVPIPLSVVYAPQSVTRLPR